MALTKVLALDIIRAHIDRRMKMEPLVLRNVLAALEVDQVSRGDSRGLAQTSCCAVAEQARAFIAGRPVNIHAVTSFAALVVAYHSTVGEVKHVA